MSSTTRKKSPWEQNPDWWKGDSKESKSFSSMRREDVSHVYDPKRNTFVDLIKANDLEIPFFASEGKIKPYAFVTFTRVQPELQKDSDIQLSYRKSLEEVTVACSPLYDLSQYGKVHCIGIGRFSDNQFKPLIENEKTDRQVSREHGLIFLKKEGNENIVCYRDVGTKMDAQGHVDFAGKRSGSTNGTWMSDRTCIRNIVLEPWPQDEILSLGEKIGNTHRFKLCYQLAPSDNDIKLSG